MPKPGWRPSRNSLAWQLAKLGFGIVLPTILFVGILLWQFASSERTRVEAHWIRLERMDGYGTAELHPFVLRNTASGSVIMTVGNIA